MSDSCAENRDMTTLMNALLAKIVPVVAAPRPRVFVCGGHVVQCMPEHTESKAVGTAAGTWEHCAHSPCLEMVVAAAWACWTAGYLTSRRGNSVIKAAAWTALPTTLRSTTAAMPGVLCD